MRHEPSPLATGLSPNEARGPENDAAPTDHSNSAPVEQRLKHVLVVDDDPALRAMVANYLVDQNVRVSTASNGREMARVLTAGGVDLVILDLNLRELLARVRAIIRRLDGVRALPAREPERGGYRFSGWQLNLRTRRLTDPNGADVALTKGEYALLVAFLDAPQRPLSREHLLQATRVHEDVFDRSIDVQILRLRRKLEQNPSAPQIIKTERGVGYVFARQVERF